MLAAALLLALAPACWDEPRAPRDAGPEAHLEASVDRGPDGGPLPLNLPKGGPGHSDVSAALSAGQVRAGRVTQQGQLLTGLKVMGRVGDYKIYNAKVAFIIEDARVSDGFGPYGGGLLDAARLGQAGTQGQSFLGELMLGIGERMQQPTSVGVVQDGSDGQPALIRAMGEPAVFPLIAAMLGGEISFAPEVYLVVDYVLAPDSEALDIRYRVVNKLVVEQQIKLFEAGVISGDGVELFSEDVGFAIDKAQAQSYMALIGPAVSYALVSLDSQLKPLVQKSGIWVLNLADPMTVPAGGEAQRRFMLPVVAGEPEVVRRAVRGLLGQTDPTARLTGKVLDPAQAPLAEARVHVQTDEATPRYVTMTRSGTGGGYSLALAPGKYKLTVLADGRASPAPTSVDLPAGSTTQDLAAGGSATVSYAVKDDKGAPLPAKLVFKAKTAPAAPPASFGERSYAWGVPLIVFSATGAGTAALAPGEYTISASRGFEYETDMVTLALADGDKQSAAFTLVRSVDSTGYMCGDFHLHAMWSPDSSDLYEMKVAALAAEGLEIPVITEHEYIADLNPTIAALGLQPWMRAFSGEEVTTVTYAHFNPYPLKPDPSKRNNGAVDWYQKGAPQLFSEIRATWPDAVLQVNHPRSSGLGGYLTSVSYDPKTGTSTSPNWSRNYDAFEVFNGAGWDSYLSSTVQDWFSFLNRGALITATGNSDSHHAYWSEVGYPRNCLKLSTDDPTKLDLPELARAVKDQRVVVSGGAFVTASVGGKGPGEVADATAKKVSLAVKVQAPTWVPLDTLRVYVGGVEKHKLTLDKTTADPLNPVIRFNQAVEVLASSDTYVVVVATGSGNLYPSTASKEPFGMTNPIYLDVDGNGVYDPPQSF